jgi:anti-sigma regulatory factor (Ser/Thr protein kinase)
MAVRLRHQLPRRLTAAALARGLVDQHLGRELDRDALDDVKLLTSELVNNAVLHGVGRIEFVADVDDDRVRIDVVDEGSGFVHQIRPIDLQQVSGRGLQVVESVSTRWGHFEGTTHVWFELERREHRAAAL